MLFSILKKQTKTILIAQSICMLMGTSTHVHWVIQNGFLSEKYNAPLFSMIFWDSLTFLDPLAAILLFVKPKIGIFLTLIIITLDILHNNIFYFEELYVNAPNLVNWISKYWMILGQIIFGIFVIFTFKKNLKEIRSSLL